MDSELVTSQLSNKEHDSKKGDAIQNRSSSFFRYSEIFDKMCAYYLSIGMTYEQYWDGDSVIAKVYREKERLCMEKRNFELWLQGLYVYNAICYSSPAFNFFSKNRKIEPYPDKPFPIFESKETEEEKKERENKLKMENGKKAMMSFVAAFNQRFAEKEANSNG